MVNFKLGEETRNDVINMSRARTGNFWLKILVVMSDLFIIHHLNSRII